MKTPKQVLDKIIIGMPDDDRMKDFIIMAMEQYARLYHENELKKLRVGDVIKRFFGIRKKLTYEERVQWFVNNFYETGMEYQIMLDNMRNDDLDNFKWYDDFIKIPKYKDEL